ncbi:MAG: BREX-1 system phosphatase PglZ type A, partial [Terriglobia bacterium]
MSDLHQITTALDRIFNEEGKRIVFWNDPEREFLEFIDTNSSLQFGDTAVQVLRLDKTSSLATKIRLEREDPTGRYLLYAPTEEPDYENDWLLDIRLYSRSFRADRASIILDELGLANQHLRQHLADRRRFFDNKDRLQKLKPLVTAEDTA